MPPIGTSRRYLERARDGMFRLPIIHALESDKPQPKTGPLLVFLPALGNTAAAWKMVADLLKNDFRCLIVEPPGFGHRRPMDSRITMRESALFVSDYFEANFPGVPVYYIGHSAGGLIAIELAKAQKAAGIVLVNAILDDVAEVLNHPLRGSFRHPRHAVLFAQLLLCNRIWLPQALLVRMQNPKSGFSLMLWPHVSESRKAKPEALWALVSGGRTRGAMRLSWSNRKYKFADPEVANIQVSTLVLESLNDPIGTSTRRSEFIRTLRSKPLVRIIGGAHCGPVEVPEEIAAIISDYMALRTSVTA